MSTKPTKTGEKTVDALADALAATTLEISKPSSGVPVPSPSSKFCRELERSGFKVFKPISDFGFYGWRPDMKGHSPFDKVSPNEIKRQISWSDKPLTLVDLKSISTPHHFSSLPDQIFTNRYPVAQYHVAALHVAQSRGLDLEDLDFIFGGSTLSMLATHRENGKLYLATKIPGTSVALLIKDDEYDHNFADSGFQFERLVTGESEDPPCEPVFVEHMHVMQVGDYRILFLAGVDAIDSTDGNPVEVTASNPRYWGINKYLQCISNGSPQMCHGQKHRGVKVTSITLKRLSSLVTQTARTTPREREKIERNITTALSELKEQVETLEHKGDFEIDFSRDGKLLMIQQSGPSKLLPSPDVTRDLLGLQFLSTNAGHSGSN